MIETLLRIVTEFDVVKVKVTKAGEERIARLRAVEKYGACLGCERPFGLDKEGKPEGNKCGQCNTCYNGALYAISKKRTTRQQLIKEGRMLAPTGGGRRPANSFTRSLSESA